MYSLTFLLIPEVTSVNHIYLVLKLLVAVSHLSVTRIVEKTS